MSTFWLRTSMGLIRLSYSTTLRKTAQHTHTHIDTVFTLTCIQVTHINTYRHTHSHTNNQGSKVSFTILDALADLPIFSRSTSVSILARLFQSLNKKPKRMDLTGDEWRKDRRGRKPVWLLPVERNKSKCKCL